MHQQSSRKEVGILFDSDATIVKEGYLESACRLPRAKLAGADFDSAADKARIGGQLVKLFRTDDCRQWLERRKPAFTYICDLYTAPRGSAEIFRPSGT